MNALRAGCALLMTLQLSGCAHHAPAHAASVPATAVPATLLGQLQASVDALRTRSRHGDVQAQAQLQAMLSGQGLSLEQPKAGSSQGLGHGISVVAVKR